MRIDSQKSKGSWGMGRCGTQLCILKCPKAGQDGFLTRAQQLCLHLKGTHPSPSFPLLSPSLAVHQSASFSLFRVEIPNLDSSRTLKCRKRESNNLLACAQEGRTHPGGIKTCFLRAYLVWTKALTGEWEWLTSLLQRSKDEFPLGLYILWNTAWLFKAKYTAFN